MVDENWNNQRPYFPSRSSSDSSMVDENGDEKFKARVKKSSDSSMVDENNSAPWG